MIVIFLVYEFLMAKFQNREETREKNLSLFSFVIPLKSLPSLSLCSANFLFSLFISLVIVPIFKNVFSLIFSLKKYVFIYLYGWAGYWL